MRSKRLTLSLSVLLLVPLLANVVWAGGRAPVKSLLEMRRENVVVQDWDLSCGAAALATVLKYQHGDDVSEKEIATALIGRAEYLENPELVRLRQGFSLLDLKRYVDGRGYKGVGYGKLSLDSLIERSPALIPIRTHGYNHFVVFRGMLGNRVLLGDPAWGNRTMTVDRLERSWIEFPEIGRVAFVVQRNDGGEPHNHLAPRPRDFLTLR